MWKVLSTPHRNFYHAYLKADVTFYEIMWTVYFSAFVRVAYLSRESRHRTNIHSMYKVLTMQHRNFYHADLKAAVTFYESV